jgi:hypothetical protein
MHLLHRGTHALHKYAIFKPQYLPFPSIDQSHTVIIVVLWLYDQKRQPQWALGITLNAVLALLTTLSKAFFMIAMAEVLSQWKWNIYNTPQGRSFHDFTLIDLASRGFLGSCMLLWRFKWQ